MTVPHSVQLNYPYSNLDVYRAKGTISTQWALRVLWVRRLGFPSIRWHCMKQWIVITCRSSSICNHFFLSTFSNFAFSLHLLSSLANFHNFLKWFERSCPVVCSRPMEAFLDTFRQGPRTVRVLLQRTPSHRYVCFSSTFISLRYCSLWDIFLWLLGCSVF